MVRITMTICMSLPGMNQEFHCKQLIYLHYWIASHMTEIPGKDLQWQGENLDFRETLLQMAISRPIQSRWKGFIDPQRDKCMRCTAFMKLPCKGIQGLCTMGFCVQVCFLDCNSVWGAKHSGIRDLTGLPISGSSVNLKQQIRDKSGRVTKVRATSRTLWPSC